MALNIRPVNEQLKKIAKDELNEIEDRIPEDIETFRTWIKSQTHLKANTDEQFLIGFLRGCKYSLEKAKSKINYFYTIHTMWPEVFANVQMDKRTIDFCRSGTLLLLPKPLGGSAGPRIILATYCRMEKDKFSFIELLRYFFMLVDLQIYDDNAVISGYHIICNFTNISLSLLGQLMDFVAIKKGFAYLEKAEPVRIKGLHMINTLNEANVLLNFLKKIASKKVQERIHIHKNFESLYKCIPQEYLPTENGGTLMTTADIQTENETKLLKFNDLLIENEKYGVDEKLRVGKCMDTQEVFGLEGSFRKLNID